MAIQWKPRHALDRLDNERPQRDVRHKIAVHDIDMQPVGAGGFNGLKLVFEPGEIGGND